MPIYSYRARNGSGEITKGTIEAKTLEGARAVLIKKELFVTDLTENKQLIKFRLSFLQKKVPLKDKIIFCEQLAVMIRAGLTLIDALKSLQGESDSRQMATTIDQLIKDIESGNSFSVSLNKHPKIFDQVFVSIVASGEQSGKLDEVLSRQAKQMDKGYDLIAKVRGALIYPAVIFASLLGVGVFVMIFILPKLKDVFEESGAPMPLFTRLIMSLGANLANYWFYYLIGIAILSVALFFVLKSAPGRKFSDRLKLRLPVFGTLFKKAYLASFSRTFSGLAAAGLPVLEIFSITGKIIPNSLYQDAIISAAKKIENGLTIAKALSESPLFPRMVSQLVIVGEKSGRLDEVFDTLANFYERDVENITKNLSTLIEPIMMLVIGLGIGVLIVAVLQPIYGLINVV